MFISKKILWSLAAIVVVLVFVGGGVLLFGGGEEKASSASTQSSPNEPTDEVGADGVQAEGDLDEVPAGPLDESSSNKKKRLSKAGVEKLVRKSLMNPMEPICTDENSSGQLDETNPCVEVGGKISKAKVFGFDCSAGDPNVGEADWICEGAWKVKYRQADDVVGKYVATYFVNFNPEDGCYTGDFDTVVTAVEYNGLANHRAFEVSEDDPFKNQFGPIGICPGDDGKQRD